MMQFLKVWTGNTNQHLLCEMVNYKSYNRPQDLRKQFASLNDILTNLKVLSILVIITSHSWQINGFKKTFNHKCNM